MTEEIAKLRVGNQRVTTKLIYKGSRIEFQFPFHRPLMAEVKMMEGAHWHGFDESNPRKVWSVSNSRRNHFQIDYLKELDPYKRYDSEVLHIPMVPRYHLIKQRELPPLKHQPHMAGHMFYRKQAILGAEMGTTKTLAAITAAEKVNETTLLNPDNFFYIAPRAALKAVEREFHIWQSKVMPTFMTYEGMVKMMKEWNPGRVAPILTIYDEASKLKNPTSQRSVAAKHLADSMRSDWDNDCYIWLLSGSPAPKSPADWYWLAEIACPGFLKEGSYEKFKRRMALIVEKENVIQGGTYPQLVTWLDDERKCAKCGDIESNSIHNVEESAAMGLEYHDFQKSVNEVAYLYKRLQGLVLIYFKRDCLDLPDKHYRIIEAKPSQSTLRAAKLITAGSKTVIQGLTRLRELSDGFQYKEVPKGKKLCPACKGNKVLNEGTELPNTCPNCNTDPNSEEDSVIESRRFCMSTGMHQPQFSFEEMPCPNCGQTGEVQDYARETVEVSCPKDKVLMEVLDEHEDVGRIVIYAGFTGSIDRVVRLCHQSGWATIRVDRGQWRAENYDGSVIHEKDLISLFQDQQDLFPKVAFVANPGSAGMGLTLTASPTIVYWSNDFNAENRIQSEDRIHRPGMDVNLGATIIDIIHLPTDMKVLENLKRKRELQAMTMGEFDEVLRTTGTERLT